MKSVFIATQRRYESTPYAFTSLSAATTFVMKKVFTGRTDPYTEENFPRVKTMITPEDFAECYTAEEFAKNLPLWSFIGDWQIQRVWITE